MSKIAQKNAQKKAGEIRERAKRAEGKAAAIGADIDLKAYNSKAPERAYTATPDISLTPVQKERMLKSGVDISLDGRSGTYLQIDHSIVHRSQNVEGLEIMGVGEALAKYDWLADYWWNLVQVDTDKYTAYSELNPYHGYFIRAVPGARSIYPLQSCLFIGSDGLVQNVHNVIIAEEDSELHVITGCAVDTQVKNGMHVGISEIYVKKNAKVSFTMIHNWAEEVVVRPRTSVVVEEGGTFLSNYVCMQPVRDIQTYPVARLVGRGAVARFNSIIVSTPGSHLDVGSKVLLEAPGTRAEIISRTVSTGGEIIARGYLRGDVPGVQAHLECQGLMLSEGGYIYAIPELDGRTADVNMSHEAAVGKVNRDEIQYLMARGLTEEEATATIVRGFLNVDIEGLPDELKKDLDEVINRVGEESLF